MMAPVDPREVTNSRATGLSRSILSRGSGRLFLLGGRRGGVHAGADAGKARWSAPCPCTRAA